MAQTKRNGESQLRLCMCITLISVQMVFASVTQAEATGGLQARSIEACDLVIRKTAIPFSRYEDFPFYYHIDTNMPDFFKKLVHQVVNETNEELGYRAFVIQGDIDIGEPPNYVTWSQNPFGTNVIYWKFGNLYGPHSHIVLNSAGANRPIVVGVSQHIQDADIYMHGNEFMTQETVPSFSIQREHAEIALWHHFVSLAPEWYSSPHDLLAAYSTVLDYVQRANLDEIKQFAQEWLVFVETRAANDQEQPEDLQERTSHITLFVREASHNILESLRDATLSDLMASQQRLKDLLISYERGVQLTVGGETYFKNVLKHELMHSLGLADLEEPILAFMNTKMFQGKERERVLDEWVFHGLSCTYDLDRLAQMYPLH